MLAATLALSACSDSDDPVVVPDGTSADGNSPGDTSPGTEDPIGDGSTDDTASGNPPGGDAQGDLPDDVARRLERALAIYRGQTIELAAAIAGRFDAPANGLVEIARTPMSENANAETVDYRCSNDGTVRSIDVTDESGLLRDRRTTFSNCRIGAFEVNGESRRGTNPVPDDVVLPAPYTAEDLQAFYPRLDLQLTDTRDGRRIQLGQNAQAYTAFPFQSPTSVLLNRNWASTGEAAISIVGGDGLTTRVSMAVGISYLDDGTGQVGDVRQSGDPIAVSGDGANGLSALTTAQPFERTFADEHYVSGMLLIAGAGVDYVLDADNGDPDSFQLTVANDGATIAYTVPWSRAFAVEGFRPSSVDLGIAG